MSEQHTPAPWTLVKCPCGHPSCQRYGLSVGMFPQGAGFDLADAQLAAAAPDLLDGCNALLGLIQLISGRDDLTPELREVLRSNYRIAEAEAAVAKAEGQS